MAKKVQPDTVKDLEADLRAAIVDLIGVERGNIAETAAFAAQKARELSLIRLEPGFDLALRAARDAVTLRAATNAVRSADALDQAGWNAGINIALRLASLAAV